MTCHLPARLLGLSLSIFTTFACLEHSAPATPLGVAQRAEGLAASAPRLAARPSRRLGEERVEKRFV